jgi:RHS repeat-associated protein
VEILLDTGGNALAKTTTMNYDADLNVTATNTYEYVVIDQTTAQTGNIDSIPIGTLLKTEERTYLVNDVNIPQATRDAYRAHNLLALPTQMLIKDGAGNIVASTKFSYDEPAYAPLTYGGSIPGWADPGTSVRGNVTTTQVWNNITGGFITTHTQYDQCGNVRKTWDANGNLTQIFYDDAFSDSIPRNTFAYATRTVSPIPDPSGEHGSSDSFVSRVTYDFSTGKVVTTIDPNDIRIRNEYNDSLHRLTRTIRAEGTTVQSQTTIQYDDSSRLVTMTSDRDTFNDNILTSKSYYDGLGRTWRRAGYEGSIWIITDTQFDALGRVSQVSNPYRASNPGSAAAPAGLWTNTAYDSLSRVIDVVTPDGAHVITQYSGNKVTITDQAGKVRRSESDALGRLTMVTEDPGNLIYDTHYSYDALDNLRQVIQDSQTRTFVYDSLSRLISATNPESGTITYGYDPNGNLIEKTDARGVKTTMTYDALNRVGTKVYSGTAPEGTAAASVTPSVSYFYDNYSILPTGAPNWSGTPSKGKLIGVTYGGDSDGTYYQYDAVGGITTNLQRMGTANYVTLYTYNLTGGIKTERRRNLSQTNDLIRNTLTYDAAGRLISLANSFNPHSSSVNLVNEISYTPFGAIQSETYGNLLIHSMSYSNRQQPTEIRLGRADNLESIFRINYLFGTANNTNAQDPEISLTQNNGNIARIKYFINGAHQYSQTFQYDPLNRLRYAVEHNNGVYNDGARAWYQTFDCDRYGNGGLNVAGTSDNVDASNNALQRADFSSENNRITRTGYTYDAAGNLIEEPGKTYTYDGENRLKTAVVSGVTSQYYYDGNGRRVKKIIGGVVTKFEYGAGGELIADRNDANGLLKAYFYKGGALLATATNGEDYEYATADQLGSPRAWTDQNGNLTVGGRHDYLPFGEELGIGVGIRSASIGYGGDSVRQKFTNKERDQETGLDFFDTRYFSSLQGRFTSIDPLNPVLNRQASGFSRQGEAEFITWISEPQRWNKYAYALNNPLRYVDDCGEDPIEALAKATQVLNLVRQRALEIAGRGGVAQVSAEITKRAIEVVFGKQIIVTTGNLPYDHEREMALDAAAFEGRSFYGVNAPGIDGFFHDGVTPTSNPSPVQLQYNTTGGPDRVREDAIDHGYKAQKAGANGVSLYVKATDPNVTVSNLLGSIKQWGNAPGGLVNLTSKQNASITQVTILAKDGVVRVDRGKVYSCDEKGKCQSH